MKSILLSVFLIAILPPVCWSLVRYHPPLGTRKYHVDRDKGFEAKIPEGDKVTPTTERHAEEGFKVIEVPKDKNSEGSSSDETERRISERKEDKDSEVSKPDETERSISERIEDHWDRFAKWTMHEAMPWMKGTFDLDDAFNFDWDIRPFFRDDDREWWKGPNVCMEREESEDQMIDSENGRQISRHRFFTSSTCDDTDTAYTCTTVVGLGDKRKTFKVTYQCCHGYQREKGLIGCTKELKLVDILETLQNLGASEFAQAVTDLGLQHMLRKGNYTIFAPADDALKQFKAEQEGMLMPSDVLVVSPETTELARETQQLLVAHISPGFLSTSDFSDEELVSTLSPDSKIRINIYTTPLKLVAANCARVTSSNNQATNGIVHVVDIVMVPVQRSISGTISKDPELSTLKTLIGRVGLNEKLKRPGQLTFFAPTNAAFAKLKEGVLDKLLHSEACLQNLLESHMLPNVICASVVEGSAKTANVLGVFLNMNRTDDNKFFVEGAQLVLKDIMATNGVIHIIDDVILQDSAMDVLDLAEKAGASEFLELVKAAGLTKTFQGLQNVTLFLPTNEAVHKLPESTRAELVSNPEDLAKVVKYHVALAEMPCASLRSNTLLSTLDSDKNILIKEYVTAPMGLRTRITAQCAPIIERDIESCNGVIHRVGKVLMPPKGDVLDTLSQDNRFSTLVHLMKKAKFAEQMQESGPFTFFAPTEEAFANLDESVLKDLEQNPEKAKQFLQRHVIKGTVCCASVFNSHWFWKNREFSLEGSLIQLNHQNGGIVVDRHVTVSECDITATNGVVHAINSVLPNALRAHHHHGRRRPTTPFRKWHFGRDLAGLEDLFHSVWHDVRDWDWRNIHGRWGMRK